MVLPPTQSAGFIVIGLLRGFFVTRRVISLIRSTGVEALGLREDLAAPILKEAGASRVWRKTWVRLT
jgi:hypothetical protein